MKNNFDKVDISKQRSHQEWDRLLDSVKLNIGGVLTKDEQDYYIDEITFKLTGKRHNQEEILKTIADGAADISDMGGY